MKGEKWQPLRLYVAEQVATAFMDVLLALLLFLVLAIGFFWFMVYAFTAAFQFFEIPMTIFCVAYGAFYINKKFDLVGKIRLMYEKYRLRHHGESLDMVKEKEEHRSMLFRTKESIISYARLFDEAGLPARDLADNASALYAYWETTANPRGRYIHFIESYYKRLPRLMALCLNMRANDVLDTGEGRKLLDSIEDIGVIMKKTLQAYKKEDAERLLQEARAENTVFSDVRNADNF